MRILRADSYRASRFGLFFALLIMVGIMAWFFFAKVTLYENSTALQIQEDGRAFATFNEEGLQRIQMGQRAILRFNPGNSQPIVTLPAVVYDLLSEPNTAELIIITNEIPQEVLAGKISGRAEVEVDYLTPAQLLMQASGRLLNQAELPVSPQKIPMERTGENP